MLVVLSCAVLARPVVVGAATADVAATNPAMIILIRHGEKPPPEAKSADLSEAGVLRAQALPRLFALQGKKPSRLPHPDALFASSASKHSNREFETLVPLSKALHEPISIAFDEDQTDELAREIYSGKYAGKVVLICWHHGRMPKVAKSLGVADAPKWQDEVFDQMWTITWPAGKLQFSTVPERLMPGDSEK